MGSSKPRSSKALAVAALLLLGLGGCASTAVREPLPPDAQAALDRLEARRHAFFDLRTLVEVEIRRGGRPEEHLHGALLLHAPASFRFEALSPIGFPLLLATGNPEGVTIWDVLDERAWLLPSTPSSTRRLLGLALSGEDLVALLAGHVVPLKDPVAALLVPPDGLGPSLRLRGQDGEQRIWFDADSARVLQVEWTGGRSPARATFHGAGADSAPTALRLATLDGKFEAEVRLQTPQVNTGLDPGLFRLAVPEHVMIRDFR